MVKPFRPPTAGEQARVARLEQTLYPTAPILLAVVAVVVLLSVLVVPHLGVKLPDFSDYLRAAGFNGMNMAGLMGIFVLFMCCHPSRSLLTQVTAIALALEAVVFVSRPHDLDYLERLNLLGIGFAVAGLAGMLRQMYHQRGESQRRVAGLLSVAGVLLLYGSLSVVFLGILSHLTPLVFDAYIYKFEGAFGTPLPVIVARFLENHPLLDNLAMAVYVRLTLFVAIGFYLNLRFPAATTSNLIAGFLLALALCFPLYLILPMVGIDMFIGSPPWPMEPPPTEFVVKWVSAPPWLPRTCAPSLHAAWIYLVFFSTYRLGNLAKALSLSVVGLTLLGTMSKTVGHYFIDVVIAVPLAVAVQAAVTFPTEENKQLRQLLTVGGLVATLIICCSLRWGILTITKNPSLFWLSLTVIVTVFLIGEYQLGRKTLKSLEKVQKENSVL